MTPSSESIDGRRVRRVALALLFAVVLGLVASAALIADGGRGLARLRPDQSLRGTAPAWERRTQFRAQPSRVERRRAELQRLHGYGWVDRDAGLVHVPVERAFDALLAEAKQGQTPQAQTPQNRGSSAPGAAP
jgi:hypothetical protein